MSDLDLMEEALEEFLIEAKDKFIAGVKEHNPDGTKGLSRMEVRDKIKAIKEEIFDLWFYVYAIEKDIDA